MNMGLGENGFVILLGIWLVLFIAGKAQFDWIKKSTANLVLQKYQSYAQLPGLSAYYREITPEWETNIVKKVYFIPHKSEMFPIPVRSDDIRQRINFTEAWVGAYLKMHGYEVLCSEIQGQQIKAILGKVKPKKG